MTDKDPEDNTIYRVQMELQQKPIPDFLMNHLPEEQLYSITFDNDILTNENAIHLANCEACRQTEHDLTILAQELTIARRSQPSPTQIARYVGLFAQYGNLYTHCHLKSAVGLCGRTDVDYVYTID